MKLSKSLRWVILLEIVIPISLLTLGIYNGLLQTLYRAGLIRSESFLGLDYYQGLTLHGVINAIVLTTFFAVAFGHAVMAYYLKKEPNSTLSWLSFILMITGSVMTAAAIFAGNSSVLYTFYPPLKASPFFYLGATLLVVGSWVAFFSWIPLYNRWRRENPDKKTPMAVLGNMVTFIIWFLATIPVAVEIIFLLIPWSVGWTDGINVMLSRTLFWFFGHPLVYFWLLPAYIMYYTFLPKLAGGKLFSDLAGRVTFFIFIILSIPVGVHHQFSEPGIDSGIKLFHSFLTFGVALPSLITAFTLAASLEYAGRKNGAKSLMGWMVKLPWGDNDNYLFSYFIVGLIIFIFGGATGIVNASYSLDMVVHNTSWLPGHFHLTVAGPVFLAILGGSIYLLSKLTGKPVRFKHMNHLVPYLWLLGLMCFSTALMVDGLHGEPRRTNLGLSYTNPESPLYNPQWAFGTAITAVGGMVMFIACIFYFIAFFGTLFSKPKEEVLLDFPTSEAYHNEKNISIFRNLAPWVVVAVILIAFAYAPPLYEAINNTSGKAPRFKDNNPVPEQNASPSAPKPTSSYQLKDSTNRNEQGLNTSSQSTKQ